MPEAATGADLDRLASLVGRYMPRRLAILGDFLHARSGRVDGTMEAFGAWRAAHAELDVLLVRGNHDRGAGDPPEGWKIRVVNEPHSDAGDGRIVMAHDPKAERAGADGLHTGMICGHIHPGVTMFGAVRTLRAKCFWLRPSVCVLPAFGSFTGCHVIEPAGDDRIFVIGPDAVAEAPRRSAMSQRRFRG